MTETMKVGSKGQIVIPQRVREELGVRPGDRVSVRAEGGEVRVRRLTDAKALRGLLGHAPMTDLEAAHAEEVELEERKAGRRSE